ncbi:MAG: transposase [Ilumatobacteraceae bacterium]
MWETVESLLPPVIDRHPLGCHRPRVDARQCFFGIAARLVTGSSWETVGRLVGVSESTLLRRRNEWQRAGVFSQLVELALSAYDQMIGLQLETIAIDGSVHSTDGR